METRIKATDYKLVPGVAAYLEERLRSLEKLLGPEESSARCEAELGRDAGGARHGEHLFFAELRIVRAGAPDAYARNRAPTVNAAIDDVKEEVERQLRRQKKAAIAKTRRAGGTAKRMLRGR